MTAALRDTRGGLHARLLFLRDYAIVGAVVVLFVVLSLTSDVFLTRTNLLNITAQVVPTAIVAFAYTWLIICGEFDLSAGAVFVLTGIVATNLYDDIGTYPALLVGILVATAYGAVNGFLVAYVRINSFVCTLATSIIAYGFTLAISQGRLLTITDSGFATIGRGSVAGLRYSIWIMILCGALVAFTLSRTKLGRWVYAVGGNPEAARLSGINTRAVKLLSFVVVGLAAGIGGAILASRTSVGQPGNGIETVFAAFSAVVVGGTSIGGGRGAIWRTVFGVFFLAMITNGFNLLGVSIYYQQIIQGVIILFAVAVDALSRSDR
jgi:ribose transport system permease protein